MPPPSRQEKTSLRIGALGLGQAGGNLATEFHKRGYRALAVNTASTDLRSLNTADGLPEDARLYVGLEGTDGAGKDPDYARLCLQHHGQRLVDEVTSRFEGVDLLLLCAGLGGGTGSCVGELYRLLEPTGLPLAAMVTLPTSSESALIKVNAVRAAQEMVDVKLYARLLVDNGRVAAMFPDADVLSYYPTANAAIVDPLDEFNRLNARTELRSVRSFDGEDFRKLLLSGGVVVPCISSLDETVLTAKDLEKHVLGAMDGGHVFAPGHTPQKVSQLAVVIIAPEDVLRETRNAAIEELERNLKIKTGGGAVSVGLYATREKETTLMVLAAFPQIPSSVEDLLGSARKEGQLLSTKIHEELPPLDVSSVAGINLSRAPAARLSRPPSPAGQSRPPAPRSVQSQVPAPASVRPKAAPLSDDTEMPERAFVEPVVTDASQEAATAAARGEAPDDEMAAPQGEDGDTLQKFYEEMVERFRKAPDRKARERVARRLIEDSRNEDEDIRALAVWAMVALSERGFRRALSHATKDANAEVKRLALDGLQRLGGADGPDGD